MFMGLRKCVGEKERTTTKKINAASLILFYMPGSIFTKTAENFIPRLYAF
jgi:hypothetical protein